MSKEQLKSLRKLTRKCQTSSFNKEDEKSGIPVSDNGASTTSTAEEVTDVASTTEEERVTATESPARHRLSDLLNGSSSGCQNDSHPDHQEGNVEGTTCEVTNGESLFPKSPKASLFNSDEPFSNEDGCSPFSPEENCVTVPCHEENQQFSSGNDNDGVADVHEEEPEQTSDGQYFNTLEVCGMFAS